jgi:eukaryotic-like serine/threonine-protein kinase
MPDTALVWLDRRGQALTSIGPGGPYRQIDLSPDGSHVVLERDGDPGLEVLDLSRGILEPLVFRTRSALVADPVWAPDGRRLAVAIAAPFGQARPAIVDVTGAELDLTPTFASGGWPEAWAVSPEGELLIYVLEDGTASGLWAAPISGTGAPKRLTPEGPHKYDQAQLSTDGRWLAYVSNETGRFEVWVQPFGRNGPRRRLSTAGGGQPRWRRNGRELFYLTGDGTMMSVALSGDMGPSSPRELFKSAIDPQPVLDRYVVSPDGQRFLAIVPTGAPPRPQLAVLVNWQRGGAGR